jgi:very-short-patch-repair endonuclease
LGNIGYCVKTQIGSAGFFVDLAVVDPDSPGRYLLGIECDGATYHSARSARDRDRLRQEVLEGLGWKIHRIWSTDWFRDPDRELKRVVEAIENAKQDVHIKAQDNMKSAQKQKVNQEIRRDDTVEIVEHHVDEYTLAEPKVDLAGKGFHTLSPSSVISLVDEVVKVESPVHTSEVMKRICSAAGIKRIGRRIQEVFEHAFLTSDNVQRRGDFLWLRDMEVPVVRDRSNADMNKKIDLICPEEIEEAIKKVVGDSFGIDIDDAVIAACQTLGFSRVTDDMKTHVQPLIKSLVDKEVLEYRNNVLTLR